MSFERYSVYVAECDGPSDLVPGCPQRAVYRNSFGDTDFVNAQDLVDQARGDGWYIDGVSEHWHEVMCPDCRKEAGE